MAPCLAASLRSCLEGVSDPRSAHGPQTPAYVRFCLALTAVIGGADTWQRGGGGQVRTGIAAAPRLVRVAAVPAARHPLPRYKAGFWPGLCPPRTRRTAEGGVCPVGADPARPTLTGWPGSWPWTARLAPDDARTTGARVGRPCPQSAPTPVRAGWGWRRQPWRPGPMKSPPSPKSWPCWIWRRPRLPSMPSVARPTSGRSRPTMC